MNLSELDNVTFWMCYIAFIVSILLIPICRNLYYICKYKISAWERDKQIINSFCDNNKCICISTHSGLQLRLIIGSVIVCVVLTKGLLISPTWPGNFYKILLQTIVTLLIHYAYIILYIDYIYTKCLVAQNYILISRPLKIY